MTRCDDLIDYLNHPEMHTSSTFRILVEDSWVECPVELLCAFVVCKGSGLDELSALLDGPVSLDDLRKAMAIVDTVAVAPPQHKIDVARIFKDANYAVEVQEWIVPGGKGLFAQFVGNIVALSLNTLGCRVVQRLIESSGTCIVQPELLPVIVDCCLDVNGNHVIQKLIETLSPSDCGFIIESLVPHAKKLALHCYGCRVVQRLISKCRCVEILEALCSDPSTISALTDDVFGNYVIQHALEYGRELDRDRIILSLASLDIIKLGCSKYASNVVEKAIRQADGGGVVVTKLLINAMLTSGNGILTLMKDRYGNYVVRAIMELTRSEFQTEVSTVCHIITKNATLLKKYTFSWHLVERLNIVKK